MALQVWLWHFTSLKTVDENRVRPSRMEVEPASGMDVWELGGPWLILVKGEGEPYGLGGVPSLPDH